MVTCYTSHAEISDFALPSRSLEDALQIAAQPSSSNAHQHVLSKHVGETNQLST